MRAISDSLSEPCPSVPRYRHAATSCNETSATCQQAFRGGPTHSRSPSRALQPATRRSHRCIHKCHTQVSYVHTHTLTHKRLMEHTCEEMSSLKSFFFVLFVCGGTTARGRAVACPICPCADSPGFRVLRLVLCAKLNLCYTEQTKRSVYIGCPVCPYAPWRSCFLFGKKIHQIM